MELLLQRVHGLEHTPGQLFVDGKFFCHTLEDKERDQKVYGETAIPLGRYEVRITMSPRFKARMPLLVDVPNFIGVRIHWGNKVEHTEGCILVGLDNNDSDDWLGQSRVNYNKLMAVLEPAVARGEKLWITIE